MYTVAEAMVMVATRFWLFVSNILVESDHKGGRLLTRSPVTITYSSSCGGGGVVVVVVAGTHI